MDLALSGWIPWSARKSKIIADAPGLYVIGRFEASPPAVVDASASEVLYIGETTRQTLRKRLRDFNTSALTGRHAHSGGCTFFANFGVPVALDWLHVAFAAPAASEVLRSSFIKFSERRLIWEFVLRNGKLPLCNRE